MDNPTLKGVAWLVKIKELYNIQQQRKFLAKKEEELSEELRKISNNKELSYGGVRYYFELRKGPIDYASIPELKNVDIEKYRKPEVSVWKIRLNQQTRDNYV